MPGELLVITSSRRRYDLFRRREFQANAGSGSAICQLQLRKLWGLHTTVALKFTFTRYRESWLALLFALNHLGRIAAPTFFAVAISYKKRPPTIDFRD
jgi:hypothetical protein